MGEQKFKMYENLVYLGHIGMMMILPILGGVYAGNFLDKKLGTGSLFFFIFIGVGVFTAFLNLYRITMKGINKNKRK
ncbi:MAG: synthase protein [Candidatus Petromonas sp.]|jgi:F0F1-type ATP synthase assembly protein I|nr:synthase protein [Candidatus Petromonas sp.]